MKTMRMLIALAVAVLSSFAGAADSPFADARWLWPAELGKDVRNTTVEFRRTFASAKAGPARLAIAADTVYEVRLNGAFVHTQRFPDVPPQRFYDVLDLPSVKAGENELVISLYVQGINTFQTLPGDPGLMFRVFGDGLSVPSDTSTAWRRSARDRADGVPLVTGQLGYSFEYDASAAEEDWKPLACGDVVRGADAFGLSERPVPRVRILSEVCEKVIVQGRLDGTPVPDVPAPGMDRTAMTPVSTAAFFEPDGRHVRPEHFAGGFYVLVDLGREEAGLLSMDVETDAGAVIDIGHAEHMENLRIRTEIDGRNFCGRYRAREGRQTFCRWQRRMAGRYIQIHVRGAKTRFALHRLSLKPVELPLPNRWVPNFADPRMTEIWRTGVRTLALCMHEHYEDCPWREQALYGNDARNQMLAGYYAFGKDWPMPAFALELHARGLGTDGWLEMCMPAKIRITIPSFTFNWVMSLGDHLKYVGDTAFLRRILPTAKAILDRRLAEMKDGLLPCPAGDRYWQFYEWRPGLDGAVYVKDGETRFESILNLDFILALEAGASCAAAVGDAATAERWRATAQTVRAAVTARFWDPAKRECRLSDDASVPAAELTQSLALLAGCVPEAAKEAVAEKLSRPSEWTEVSLSQTLYKYEALIAAGSETAKRAVAQMTDLWQSMLDRGATSFWETTEGWKDFGSAGSLCHGWSAVPIYIAGAHPELVPLADRSSFGPLSPSARPYERQYIWPEGRMPMVQPHQVAAKSSECARPDFDREAYRRPYIDWYRPNAACRTDLCVITVSGGGFEQCCDADRLQPAIDRLVAAGITVADVTYRTPRPLDAPVHQSAWIDLQRAVRVVKSEAARRGFSPDKVGATGISAGAKAILLVATSSLTDAYEPTDEIDRLPSNLLFAIPQAPAYVLTDGATEANARGGDSPDVKIVPELKFDAKTCPMCLFQGGADRYSPLGTTQIYRQLRRMKIPAEIHLFADRWHGFHGDMNRAEEDASAWDRWFDRAMEFIRQMNYDGRLGAEVPLMDRFADDAARACCLREPVWPEGAMPDVQTNQCEPYLEWHFPKELRTKSIQLIYSGGSYMGNSPDGFEVAPARRYLNAKGMTVVTLKYRTPRPLPESGLLKHVTAWEDLQRAIRIIRSRAPDYGLDPKMIGIMGSSAGGHLTLMGATTSRTQAYGAIDRLDETVPCNVQWAVAIYPAYALTDGAEKGNARGGNEDDSRPVPEFAFDLDTCPVLFVHGDADGWASMNSVKCWEQLRRMGIQGELHTLATRSHCFQRSAAPGTGSYTWLDRIWEFMNHKGFNRPCAPVVRPRVSMNFDPASAPVAEWRAKWIGSNPAFLPEVDFSAAKWSDGDKVEIAFDAPDEGLVELVATAAEKFSVTVNGQPFWKWEGHVYDARRLRHFNLRPALKSGRNVVTIEGGHETIAVVRDAARRVLAASAGTRGGAKETAFGRDVEWREETVSPAFEKRFTVRGEVKRAVLHVTGVGFYEISLNGTKVGDKVLDPSPTDYDRRVLYSSYEVTGLRPGENVLRLLLGHGWYDMRTAATWNFDSAPWRDFPKGIVQLEIAYADGSAETVVTDGTWEQIESPVRYDCIREGEVVDARVTGRPLGVCAAEVAGPRGTLEPARLPGAKVVREDAPEKISRTGEDEWVVTFPETIAGWVRLRPRGLAAGDRISIRYDENLGTDGGPAVSSKNNWFVGREDGRRAIDIYFQQEGSFRATDGAPSSAQTDHFVSAGRDGEVFEPRFVYHGFRHVYVKGLKGELAVDDIRACRVRTDFATTGSFACSDANLTELVRMALNSYRANFTDGFPTDCPHREKLGWTGDAWIASQLGMEYFDNAAAYLKWLTDVLDTQKESGEICCIAPTGGWGFQWGNGPVFDLVLTEIPANLWKFRGSREGIDCVYPALRRYLAYLKTQETESDLVAKGLGDWNAKFRELAPTEEYVISCAYLRLRERAAEFAALEGRPDEAADYAAAAERTRQALRRKYRKGDGVYDNGRQAAQAFALFFGLASEGEKPAVMAALVKAIEKEGFHFDCGLLGAKTIYRVLSDNGRTDLALKMLLNPTEPTMVKWIGRNGTLWEDWTTGFSKCHIMLGDFASWAMECLAGLRAPVAPGYRYAVIEPVIAPGIGWAKAETQTPYGRLASAWRTSGGRFEIDVDVPEGVNAVLRLPDGTGESLPTGHSFRSCVFTVK